MSTRALRGERVSLDRGDERRAAGGREDERRAVLPDVAGRAENAIAELLPSRTRCLPRAAQLGAVGGPGRGLRIGMIGLVHGQHPLAAGHLLDTALAGS